MIKPVNSEQNTTLVLNAVQITAIKLITNHRSTGCFNTWFCFMAFPLPKITAWYGRVYTSFNFHVLKQNKGNKELSYILVCPLLLLCTYSHPLALHPKPSKSSQSKLLREAIQQWVKRLHCCSQINRTTTCPFTWKKYLEEWRDCPFFHLKWKEVKGNVNMA